MCGIDGVPLERHARSDQIAPGTRRPGTVQHRESLSAYCDCSCEKKRRSCLDCTVMDNFFDLIILQAFFGTPNGASLDFVAKNLQTGAQGISEEFPQVRVLDVYTLFAVSSGDKPPAGGQIRMLFTPLKAPIPFENDIPSKLYLRRCTYYFTYFSPGERNWCKPEKLTTDVLGPFSFST